MARLLPIVLYCLIIIPVSLIGFLVMHPINLIFAYGILVGCAGSILWLLYTLYKVIIHRHIEILELREEGLRYPYMLNPSLVILWEDIMDIRMDEYTAPSSRSHIVIPYVVIEIHNSVDLGEKKTIDGNNTYFSKNSLHQVIVISQRTMSHYHLQEIHDLLKWQWKKYTHQRIIINTIPERLLNNPRFERLINRINRVVIPYETCFSLTVHGAYLIFFMALISLIIEFQLQPNSKPLLLLSGCFLIAVYVMFLLEQTKIISKSAAKYEKAIAIDFDKKGIYQINNKRYTEMIPWTNVLSIELKYKSKRGFSKPYLKFTVHDHKGRLRIACIRNALKDTSVFELDSALTNYMIVQ